MHHTTDRIIHTTAFVTPIVEHWLEREIAQCVRYECSIRRPIAPRSYHGATSLYRKIFFLNCERGGKSYMHVVMLILSLPKAF